MYNFHNNISKLVLLVFFAFSITSCSGKLLFKKEKKPRRSLIYNEKYIQKAKKNIIENGIEEEEYDDDDYLYKGENPTIRYKKRYLKMLKEEGGDRTELNRRKRRYMEDISDDEDVSLYRTKSKIHEVGKSTNDLESELSEIKKMLLKTQDQIEKSKCPYSENDVISKKSNKKSASKNAKNNNSSNVEKNSAKKLEEKNINPIISKIIDEDGPLPGSMSVIKK